ncbi:MAG: PD-(D/E)XK nuclease family protein [Lachnospiraceae bacterium]
MFSIRAQEVYEEAAEDAEPLLVQGIIDAYFEENGQWILVDYKTDHVNHRNGKELLKKRYEMQLRYYAKALSSLTGKPVSERVIYSFALGEAFTV